MADYRRHIDERPARFHPNAQSPRVGHPGHQRDWSDRAGDEVRPWFGDRATGSYRTDDRGYHDRYRQREDGYPYRDRELVADEMAAEVEPREPNGRSRGPDDADSASWGGRPWLRERGGYWRQYESQRAPYAGRGPKNRVREEICDCMTDDPLLDASEIVVQVSNGEVTLSGSVSSREQKRRAEDVAERVSGVTDVTNQLRIAREANGHSQTASQPVSQAYGTETPSKSASGNSA